MTYKDTSQQQNDAINSSKTLDIDVNTQGQSKKMYLTFIGITLLASYF